MFFLQNIGNFYYAYYIIPPKLLRISRPGDATVKTLDFRVGTVVLRWMRQVINASFSSWMLKFWLSYTYLKMRYIMGKLLFNHMDK